MTGYIALQAGAEGFFALECVVNAGGVGLRLVELCRGLSNLRRKLALGMRDASALDLKRLQIYQLLDQGIHGGKKSNRDGPSETGWPCRRGVYRTGKRMEKHPSSWESRSLSG